jgi:hypothetical protein
LLALADAVFVNGSFKARSKASSKEDPLLALAVFSTEPVLLKEFKI